MAKKAGVILITMLSCFGLTAQISPGDLAGPHSHLEGISNCTQCHVLGDKVSNEKCLKCHTEIQQRISRKKGYHASGMIRGKQCITCHSDHHGKKFQLIRIDVSKFDHTLTGYPLSVPHAKKECNDCHAAKYIVDQKLKIRKNSYLGVGTACLNCHDDYHRKSLSPDCLDCHNSTAFKPATIFNHANARFQLLGQHKNVDCIKCHKMDMTEGKKFQQFKGVAFANCTNCHKDPHQNQFGQNCRQCHTEESFLAIRGTNNFDHNKTKFRLEGKHVSVNCKACHPNRFTDPLRFERCTDCHKDYHAGQFVKNTLSPDCSQCHSVKGFALSSYTLDQHNMSIFPLKGAHMAIPCTDCHKKQEKWSFRDIGIACIDCHKDIHQPFIQTKYYPEANCKICHLENRWADVTFNHALTEFDLTGAHKYQLCRACHISRDPNGMLQQKFAGLTKNCSGCHIDNHFRQFEKNGITNCESCHNSDNWQNSKFDHNTAAFKLDGKHKNVPCGSCHKPVQQGTAIFINYKIKEFKCESCHL
jgi:hypothetical protein